MVRLASRFASSIAGTSAIEFAFIAPMLIMMFAGVIEIGRFFQVYNATNRLATQYAIVWSDCSDIPAGTCSTEMSTLGSSYAIANIVPQLQANALSLSFYQVQMSGSTPTIVYSSPAGSALTASQTAAAQNVIANGQSGVIVTASYVHSLQFFQILMTPYLASALTASYTAVQLKG